MRLAKIISDILFGRNGGREALKLRLTRNQARKILIDYIAPYLLSVGFTHHKNLRFWRVTSSKTDVIELRFLFNLAPEANHLPQSTFSVLGGSYFTYIPNAFDERFIYQIPGIVSPDETHCHLRFTAQSSTNQSIFKDSKKWWHLDCDELETLVVLKDVETALKEQVFPLMDKFEDINEFLSLLKGSTQPEVNIEIGKPDSFIRQYLIGFTSLELNDKKSASHYLSKAKSLLDDILDRADGEINLKADSPIMKQFYLIERALVERLEP